MSLLLENFQPEVSINGLNTNKAVAFGSTLAVTGASTIASTLDVTGAVTMASSLAVTGAFTQTGGIAGQQPIAVQTVPIGSVAYASFGTDTATVAGSIYYCSITIPSNMTVTNINVLQGATVATDKLIGALYNSAGTKVANSALAGVITAGANTFLTLPLTATYSAIGPGKYFLAIQSNGTTDTFRSVAASTFVSASTGSKTGAFGTLTSITAPTTFTANVGPIAYLN